MVPVLPDRIITTVELETGQKSSTPTVFPGLTSTVACTISVESDDVRTQINKVLITIPTRNHNTANNLPPTDLG